MIEAFTALSLSISTSAGYMYLPRGDAVYATPRGVVDRSQPCLELQVPRDENDVLVMAQPMNLEGIRALFLSEKLQRNDPHFVVILIF